MRGSKRGSGVRERLLSRLTEARARTDELFRIVQPAARYERPIPERHRIIFYLGHLEAFDWNLIGGHGLGLDPIHKEFDRLFAFGIDPVDENLPTDKPSDWPKEPEIRKYNRHVRNKLDEIIRNNSFDDPAHPLFDNAYIFNVSIEHRLMHAETFTYMLHHLSFKHKIPPRPIAAKSTAPVKPRIVEIPEGTATLGMNRSEGHLFGWDNEFERNSTTVPRFSIDAYNVTNGEFLEFIQCGAYEDRKFWTSEDWEWKTSVGVHRPYFWKKRGQRWIYCAMFAEIPLPLQAPVYVSHAEASAYARWKGKSLPTEAQWHRAAVGTSAGQERLFPWGDEPPSASHGNFNFARWDTTDVGSYPDGNSAFGVADLVGNGWEWTSSLFEPFPGFERFSFYPGYSANFFDGKHYVLKGGSHRTAACVLRRSFRNWFQPHYPYIYATFRCVEN